MWTIDTSGEDRIDIPILNYIREGRPQNWKQRGHTHTEGENVCLRCLHCQPCRGGNYIITEDRVVWCGVVWWWEGAEGEDN